MVTISLEFVQELLNLSIAMSAFLTSFVSTVVNHKFCCRFRSTKRTLIFARKFIYDKAAGNVTVQCAFVSRNDLNQLMEKMLLKEFLQL